jgi:hypothetical protein
MTKRKLRHLLKHLHILVFRSIPNPGLTQVDLSRLR